MYQYHWPMASIGVCAFFYYKKNGETILFMQRRSPKMYHAPNKIALTGGYYDAHVAKDGSVIPLPENLRREIREEIGEAFEKSLPEKTFTIHNIAMIRHKSEEKAMLTLSSFQRFVVKTLNFLQILPEEIASKHQVNINFVWVAKITEEQANKAIIADSDEVAELLHMPLNEVMMHPDVREWIPLAITNLLKKDYFQ